MHFSLILYTFCIYIELQIDTFYSQSAYILPLLLNMQELSKGIFGYKLTLN
jgi:hypothetical protein